jgi:signal transduction histidine kinase
MGDADGELPPSKASILLVDDNPANLLALEGVLEPLGHRLVKARSGEEALKWLLKEEFALILMDVRMPGLDGFQTVALIKQRPRMADIPVIFISALAREASDISTGYRYGAVDYLAKPFDPDLLRCKVSVLVALHLQAERIARQREQLVQRKLELQLEEAHRAAAEKASQMKDQFLTMISHELRTPLNAILGWTEMLARLPLDEERVRRALATIQRNAETQKRLVEDLIDVSTMISGRFRLRTERLDLREVLEAALESARPAAAQKQVSLAADLEPHGPVRGDGTRLQQVVANLLSNAIKYTPPGGSVRLGLAVVGKRVEMRVADTGMGIAKENLEHVFERFWQASRLPTTASAGLGLGLAIADHLTRLHGGELRAASDGLGRGSTFTVSLPFDGGALELQRA